MQVLLTETNAADQNIKSNDMRKASPIIKVENKFLERQEI